MPDLFGRARDLWTWCVWFLCFFHISCTCNISFEIHLLLIIWPNFSSCQNTQLPVYRLPTIIRRQRCRWRIQRRGRLQGRQRGLRWPASSTRPPNTTYDFYTRLNDFGPHTDLIFRGGATYMRSHLYAVSIQYLHHKTNKKQLHWDWRSM